MKVQIVGLHKADVLFALYSNAKFNGPGFASQPMLKVLAHMAPPANPQTAKALIDEAFAHNNFYFDYIDLGSGSCPLKVDLSGFDFDPRSYDHNHGYPGYAFQIIDALRSQYVSELSNQPEGSFAHLLSQIGLLSQTRANENRENNNEHDSDNESRLSNS